MSEDGMLSVEKAIVLEIDEKLAAIRIRTGIGHRDSANIIAILHAIAHRCLARIDLIGRRISRPSRSPIWHLAFILCQRVASLDHEIRNDAMKSYPVIESLGNKPCEIGSGFWSPVMIQADRDIPMIRMEDDMFRLGILHGHSLAETGHGFYLPAPPHFFLILFSNTLPHFAIFHMHIYMYVCVISEPFIRFV